MGSTTLRLSVPFHCNTATPRKEQSIKTNTLTTCFRPRQHNGPRYTTLCYSRRRRESAAGSTTPKKFSKKKPTVEEEDGDIDEDAFEALFRQLEEDLKNDELFGDEGGDDEISEEELAKLEQELAEALEDDDELLGMFESIAHGHNADEEKEDVDGLGEDEDGDQEDYNDDEEEQPLNLKNWQIRRLAYALKIGRRKTNIKDLAAELCLDRAVVLNILRDPPPKLVMLSASLPDKPVETILTPVENHTEIDTVDTKSESKNTEVEAKLPVHVMQSNWSARKRLKKVQVETLEEVYRRTKRPTNAMISSIVHVTNLPRKRVVKWFEDKRAEDGVPEQRRPYNRSASDSVFTN